MIYDLVIIDCFTEKVIEENSVVVLQYSYIFKVLFPYFKGQVLGVTFLLLIYTEQVLIIIFRETFQPTVIIISQHLNNETVPRNNYLKRIQLIRHSSTLQQLTITVLDIHCQLANVSVILIINKVIINIHYRIVFPMLPCVTVISEIELVVMSIVLECLGETFFITDYLFLAVDPWVDIEIDSHKVFHLNINNNGILFLTVLFLMYLYRFQEPFGIIQ